MTLTRLQYYLFVLAIAISPFVIYRIGWLIFSTPTIGKVLYVGQTHGRTTGRQTYPVVAYSTGRHTLTTAGDYNLPYAEGDSYPIRFSRFNEADTMLNTFLGCWLDTIIWGIIFTVIISISFIVDGIVPRRSLVNLSWKGLKFVEATGMSQPANKML